MTLHIETPLLESHPLSLAADCAIWLKLEALQPPGSFKIRGISAACEEYARRGKGRFISSFDPKAKRGSAEISPLPIRWSGGNGVRSGGREFLKRKRQRDYNANSIHTN